MSAGYGFRSRAIDSVGALTPAHILEYSKLIDAGMVFKWDASGPSVLMQQAPLVNALPEFAYLAIDLQPAQLFIKRSRPGVTPPVWERCSSFHVPGLDWTTGEPVLCTPAA